jgi:hypothetical protein
LLKLSEPSPAPRKPVRVTFPMSQSSKVNPSDVCWKPPLALSHGDDDPAGAGHRSLAL